MIKYYFAGLFTNIVTSLDDTLTQIPVISYVTRTRKGKIGFCIGIFLAMILVVALAMVLASIIERIDFYKYIVSGLMFLLAVVIYFDLLNHKEKKAKKRIEKVKKIKKISRRRFMKMVLFGFITAFATVVDDTIAFSSILAGHTKLIVGAGILSATVLQIFVILGFSKHINEFKYKKEISSFGLVLIGLLVLFGVI
jgi:predicted tellurium resistance membrane protein TerC